MCNFWKWLRVRSDLFFYTHVFVHQIFRCSWKTLILKDIDAFLSQRFKLLIVSCVCPVDIQGHPPKKYLKQPFKHLSPQEVCLLDVDGVCFAQGLLTVKRGKAPLASANVPSKKSLKDTISRKKTVVNSGEQPWVKPIFMGQKIWGQAGCLTGEEILILGELVSILFSL